MEKKKEKSIATTYTIKIDNRYAEKLEELSSVYDLPVSSIMKMMIVDRLRKLQDEGMVDFLKE